MISQLSCHTYSKFFTFFPSSLILPRSTTPMMSPAVRWAQTRPLGCCRRWHRPPGTLPCYYKGAGWLSLRRLLSLPSLHTFAATCTLLYSSHFFVLTRSFMYVPRILICCHANASQMFNYMNALCASSRSRRDRRSIVNLFRKSFRRYLLSGSLCETEWSANGIRW